jgi:ribosome-associated protein
MKLDQFLKFQGVVATGGQAKQVIQDGRVVVNGVLETRRGRKLVPGDRVTIEGNSWLVEAIPDDE